MRRINKDERGSSLVMTIVAISFISLLAVAVVTMTISNIWLKAAQKQSQKHFYDADSIVDMIRAGVENESDKAARDAYNLAFSAYGSVLSGTKDSLTDRYTSKYLENMINQLKIDSETYSTATTDYHYKYDTIRGFLPAAQADYYVTTGSNDMILSNDSIVLKNIKVTKTKDDYATTITTDIRITVPPMTSATNSEYLNYAFIADNQIKVEMGSGAVTSVNGNVYAGTVNRNEPAATDPEAGIIVGNGSTFNLKADYVITRGDMLIRNAANLNLAGLNQTSNVWAENIQTSSNSNSSSGNDVTISAICNISDDMNISGANDRVKLTGKYYGYNFSDSYPIDPATSTMQPSKKAEYSSSISVNGRSESLDLSGLDTLVLSGRTFISRKTNKLTEAGNMYSNNDIAMGESLAVKGNQLAYYVPSDFAHPEDDCPFKDEDGNDKAGIEPYTSFQLEVGGTCYHFHYNDYDNYIGFHYTNASTNILDFLKTVKDPITADALEDQPLVRYYRHDSEVSTKAVTYFYLNFKDEQSLIDFYPLYENATPSDTQLKDTMATVNAGFLSGDGIKLYPTGSSSSDAVLIRSGNLVYGNSGTKAGTTEKTSFTTTVTGGIIDPVHSALVNYAKSKSKEYISRQMSLVADYETAINSSQWRLTTLEEDGSGDTYSKSGNPDGDASKPATKTNLFAKLINDDKLPATVTKKLLTVGTQKCVVYIDPRANATCKWDSSTMVADFNGANTGIIIAKGDVQLDANFDGLVIAGGDIIVNSSGLSFNAKASALKKLFDYDQSNNKIFYNIFTKYFRKTVQSSIENASDLDDEPIYYENWKKE